MRVGIAADHAGFGLKDDLARHLREAGHEVVDFGAAAYDPADDYPDFVLPLARAIASGEVERGVCLCGSGVGACIAANKIAGVRAAITRDLFSAQQGVEDDDMNCICLAGRLTGLPFAIQLADAFLGAKFSQAERHRRRLDKVLAAESGTMSARH